MNGLLAVNRFLHTQQSKDIAIAGGGAISALASILVGIIELKHTIFEAHGVLSADRINTIGEFLRYLSEFSDIELLGVITLILLTSISISYVFVGLAQMLILVSRTLIKINWYYVSSKNLFIKIDSRLVDLTKPDSVRDILKQIEKTAEL